MENVNEIVQNDSSMRYRHRIDYCPACAEKIYRIHFCDHSQPHVGFELHGFDRDLPLDFNDGPGQ